MEVYKELGRGFVEYVYQDAMAIEFKLAGIDYEKESQLKIYYKGNELEDTTELTLSASVR
jgi:GxxExxY protein